MVFTVVEPVTRQALPYGLFSTFTFRPNGERWFNGVTFEGQPCGPSAIITDDACDDDPEGWPDAPEVGEDIDFHRITATGIYKCSPVGNSIEYAQDQAVARLQAGEQSAVETHLWSVFTGLGFDAEGFTDLTEALAELEQHIADNYGALGTLHVSRYTATLLISEGLIEVKGNRAQTKLGTPVAVGAGYGDGMVATAAMTGYRSEIYEPSNFPGDLLNRATNDLNGLAARDFLVGFEQCGFRAVNIERN